MERERHLEENGVPECFTDYFLLEMKKSEEFSSFTRRQLYFFQGENVGGGGKNSK